MRFKGLFGSFSVSAKLGSLGLFGLDFWYFWDSLGSEILGIDG